MQPFKIRASAAHHITGRAVKITEKQLETLATLEAKEKLTPAQQKTLDELKAKRDAPPELSQGAKAYCKKWVKQQREFYNRTADFSSKYTEKGTECEPDAIRIISQAMGFGEIFKNEEHFEDADFTGTPDLVLGNSVEDAKCSWSWETFPLFETHLPDDAYGWQMQVYMALTELLKAGVNYCLIDTPINLIEREAKNQSYKAGYVDVDNDLYDEAFAKMTYTDVPVHLKHKRFEVLYDANLIKHLREQVELCRAYIQTLIEPFTPSPSTLIATKKEDGVLLIEGA